MTIWRRGSRASPPRRRRPASGSTALVGEERALRDEIDGARRPGSTTARGRATEDEARLTARARRAVARRAGAGDAARGGASPALAAGVADGDPGPLRALPEGRSRDHAGAPRGGRRRRHQGASSPTSCSRPRSWRPPSRRCWASGWATSSSTRTRRASRRSSSSSGRARGGRRSSRARCARTRAPRGQVRLRRDRGGAGDVARRPTRRGVHPRRRQRRDRRRLAEGRRRARADARADRLRPAVRRGRVATCSATCWSSRIWSARWRCGARRSTDKTIVTLEGEVIDPQGVVTGGSRESALTGVLEQKREIRELEQVMARLDADLESALARQIERKQAAADLSRALEEAAAALRSDEMALFGLKKDLDRVVQEGSACETRREQLAAPARRPGARRPTRTSSAWSRRSPGWRATGARSRRARRARSSCASGPPRWATRSTSPSAS